MRVEMSALARAGIATLAAAVCAASVRAQTPVVAVLPVQGTVSMITVAGVNVTVQVGKNGVVLVDAPPAEAVQAVMTEVRRLTDKPVRYIVNTNADADHVGGNAAPRVGRRWPRCAWRADGLPDRSWRDAGKTGHHRAHQRARSHVEGGAGAAGRLTANDRVLSAVDGLLQRGSDRAVASGGSYRRRQPGVHAPLRRDRHG